MRQFKSTKRISLAEAGGEGWEEAFIVASIPSFPEAQQIAITPTDSDEAIKLAETVLGALKQHFVSGKAPFEGELVDLTAEDIENMPLTVIAELRENLFGAKVLSPNS